MADIAHPAGLIAKGLLNDPMPHCHIVTTTTHKTLRGPRGGAIMMGKNFENPWGRKTSKGSVIKMSSILDSGVFPGMQGGPLEHVIAAKAIAFGEALTDEYKSYVIQVKKNAQAMAGILADLDYKIISGGTDNHLMLVDLSNKNISGKEAEEALVQADITVNKNMVPFDQKSPMVTSGIRIGTPAITTRGLLESECIQIVQWMDQIINNHADHQLIAQIRKKVNNMMA